MNEDTNILAAVMLALNQLQSVKEKIDPEAFELLNKSGHEAINSAHHFLDACEKILDSLVSPADDEIDLTQDSDSPDNIVSLRSSEAK